MENKNFHFNKIAIVGLGYVGLPLAMAFARHKDVIGYDYSQKRIQNLIEGIDTTNEVSADSLINTSLHLTSESSDLNFCDVYIITVPTPVTADKNPDLSFIETATRLVASILKVGDVVIYESTVFPGCTEDFCVPLLEKHSGLIFNEDFFCGYSPERINPGDAEHRLNNTVKITSGSTPVVAKAIDQLYGLIVHAGTHSADSIKTAECAKVIENVQRDINIALINEFSIIFSKLGLNTEAVLQAAETKWNFMKFRPGLVGGHCIGVDPYYLLHAAENAGYNANIITAGRKLNDGMSQYVVSRLDVEMMDRGRSLFNSKILILGFAFKENCPDIRNTKVYDICNALYEKKATVDIYDPVISQIEAQEYYDVQLIDKLRMGFYDAIILAVKHDIFKTMNERTLRALGNEGCLIFDLKYMLDAKESDIRL